jgi:hypothetical protein
MKAIMQMIVIQMRSRLGIDYNTMYLTINLQQLLNIYLNT